MVIFRLEKRERSQIQMTKQNQKSPANAGPCSNYDRSVRQQGSLVGARVRDAVNYRNGPHQEKEAAREIIKTFL